jgi:uncharacterized protein (DUF58 family)
MWINKFFFTSPANRIYIIPTFDGIKLITVNLLLLILGLTYANNFVLLFNFLLFCIFLSTMFYTNYNLQGIRVVEAEVLPRHANEPGTLKLFFQTKSKLGHYFISAKFFINGEEIISPLFNIEKTNLTYSMTIPKMTRGLKKITRVEISTKFPFHLFKSFTYSNISTEFIIYPARINHEYQNGQDQQASGSDLDDFKIRNYQIGDSPNRIIWKKASGIELLVRDHDLSQIQNIIFRVEDLKGEALEQHLSEIVESLYRCSFSKISFGIETSQKLITASEFDSKHLERCLSLLGVIENKNES